MTLGSTLQTLRHLPWAVHLLCREESRHSEELQREAARELALPQHREQQTLTVALPHMLHCDDLSLPAGDGLQLALVPISDTIRATHLGGRGET